MKCIPRILKATGMSQAMLADYLGIRRQSLMDAATGRKCLGSKKILQLSRLECCIEMTPPDTVIKDPDLKKQENHATGCCGHGESRIKECRYKAFAFQKKLKDYEQAQRKNNQLLKALDLLEPANEREEIWIELRKADALKKLKRCSEANCAVLRKRIYLLHAEADYINSLINEQMPGPKKV